MNNNTTNQAIIINDLLSFLSCKIKVTPREKLLKTIRDYYPEKALLHAQKTLLDSLPEKKSTRHGRRVKHPDPVIAMYDCFQLIPDEDLPVFVCQNLNNVPHIDVIKTEKLDDTVHDDYDDSHTDIKEEQKAMKSQIADIADVVQQIKDQLKHIVDQQQSPKNSVNLSRKEYISTTGTKRKKSNTNSATKKFSLVEHKEQLEKSPKKTMAYLQQLIDEEEEMKSDPLCQIRENDSDYLDENDMSDTDLYNDILSEEERNAEKAICEVLLKEGAEGFDQSSIQSRKNSNHSVSRKTKGTPLKVEGQKVIYIKNEEDFDIPSDGDFLEDGSDSIEISSADNIGLGNLEEIDASSRIDHHDPVIIVSHCGTENSETNFFFTCTGCNLSSRNKHTFDGHKCASSTVRKTKNSRYGYVCTICDYETLDIAQFNEHMLGHYDMIPDEGFECILCIFKSNSYEEYRAHLIEHSWKRPYRCDSCSYKCYKELRFKNHTIRHLECKGPNHFECIICGKICGTRNTMEKHKQMHKRNFDFRCEYCGITFRHKSALSQHILLSHTKERTFVCSICNCLYDSQHSLDIHMKVHFKDNFFTCHVCSEKIKSKTSFRNHILTKHADIKAFKCETCGEAFTFKHTLLMHRKRHETQLFACPYCNKKFKCQSYQKIHCAIHEGKKPYKCSHCDFESASKTELKKHLSVHDEPYMFSCQHCNFLTTQPLEFESHKLSHDSDHHVAKEPFVDQVMVVMAE